MFDMSWGEVLLIGGVALIVIGPKDLPRTLRMVGQTVGKVRRMASEFQGQFNEAMREADLEDAKKEIEGLNRHVSSATQATFNPLKTIRDEIKGSIESRGATAAVASDMPMASEPASLAGPSEPDIALPEAAPETAIATTAAEMSGAAPDPLAPAIPPEALLEGSHQTHPAYLSEDPVALAGSEMVADPQAHVTPAAIVSPEPTPPAIPAEPSVPVSPPEPTTPAAPAKPGLPS